MVLKRQMEVEMGVPLGRVGSLGLGTGQQSGFTQSSCMLPQGTEQPDLGSEQLIVGELEQQLLAWRDKEGCMGGALKLCHIPFPQGCPYLPGSCSSCPCT